VDPIGLHPPYQFKKNYINIVSEVDCDWLSLWRHVCFYFFVLLAVTRIEPRAAVQTFMLENIIIYTLESRVRQFIAFLKVLVVTDIRKLLKYVTTSLSLNFHLYNTVWHDGFSNADMVTFLLLLLSDYLSGMKIVDKNSSLSSLASCEPKN
jgi:hypothetical protein